ncbi:YcjF family protein [Hydrogenophaga sp.]
MTGLSGLVVWLSEARLWWRQRNSRGDRGSLSCCTNRFIYIRSPPRMSPKEQQSILTIALLAAFADGHKADTERESIRRLAESLGPVAGGMGLAHLYQDVLLKRVSLADAVAGLQDAGQRQLAYEMAVCVCDADGRQSDAERAFLVDLKTRLKLDPEEATAFERQEAAMVDAVDKAVPVAVSPVAAPPPVTATADPGVDLDKSILNYALLNGALELLPQSWASMAIIPLQVKMVYGIGKAHGVELDQGHIREFIAAVGVGLTSQYLEQFGRKLLGGLLGKAAGRTVGRIGGAATGMAFSFASTYALGQVAKRYYAGGRVMSTHLLKQTFQDLLGPARQMQAQYLPQIQQKAATLDAGQIMQMVRQ